MSGISRSTPAVQRTFADITAATKDWDSNDFDQHVNHLSKGDTYCDRRR